jgi:hypothetical protein
MQPCPLAAFFKLQAKVPKAFIDLTASANAEFDTTYANTHVIQSAVCNTIKAIELDVGTDFKKHLVQGANQCPPICLPHKSTNAASVA